MTIGRRQFISTIGGGAFAWPLAARAQQPALPVVGFLNGQSPDAFAPNATAFRLGLQEAGYIVGQNVEIEYRWAEGHTDRLPALVADLVGHRVKVIAATGGVASARAAKAATTTIPIVFNSGEDPVAAGLVSSLSRPGGNITGVSWFSVDVAGKRLALLHELVPAAMIIAMLLNPSDPESAPSSTTALEAARALGRQLVVVHANTADEIDVAFTALVQQRAAALVVGSGPFLQNRRDQIIALAAQHAIPTTYSDRQSPASGGLMSYGNNLADAYRRNAICVGRILKGDKPSDLPVDRSTKFELVINLKTAKALGLEVPPTLLARADEVIE
jgi:putative ABC transport system substrate-binding protein